MFLILAYLTEGQQLYSTHPVHVESEMRMLSFRLRGGGGGCKFIGAAIFIWYISYISLVFGKRCEKRRILPEQNLISS